MTEPVDDSKPSLSAGLSRLAHDLRGPLNVIAMNVALLRALPPEHPSRGDKLTAIEGSVETLTRLIDRIAAETAPP